MKRQKFQSCATCIMALAATAVCGSLLTHYISLFVSLFNLFAHGLTDKGFPWQFLEDADRVS